MCADSSDNVAELNASVINYSEWYISRQFTKRVYSYESLIHGFEVLISYHTSFFWNVCGTMNIFASYVYVNIDNMCLQTCMFDE